MDKLDEAIAGTAYILDSLRLLREILETGNCNDCSNKKCEYMPQIGQRVRYNCPFYKTEVKRNGNSTDNG